VTTLGISPYPYCLLVLERREFKTGGDDRCFGRQGEIVRFLEIINGICGTHFGALSAQGAVFHIHEGHLGNGGREWYINSLARGKSALFLIGDINGAVVFALPATDALNFINKSGLLSDPGRNLAAGSLKGLQFAIGKDGYVGMMGCRRHFGGGNAAGAVQGGKDLGKPNHLASDGGILFNNGHLEILVGQIQGRL